MRQKIAFIALLVFVDVAVDAAVVHLKTGQEIRGTVVSATAREVQIHTADGLQKIDTAQISRIDYAEDAPPAPVPAAPTYPTVTDPWRVERANSFVGNQLFSLGFGMAIPTSRVDFTSTGGGTGDNGDTGFLLSTQYVYYPQPRLGVAFNLEFFNRGRTGTQSLLPEANTDVSGNTLLIMPGLRYSLVDRGNVRPFIFAGVGANRTSTIVEATPNVGFAWSDTNTAETRTLADDSHWGLATSARLGIDFLMDVSLFTLELGWTGLHNADATTTTAGQDVGLTKVKGELDVLMIGARWGWRF